MKILHSSKGTTFQNNTVKKIKKPPVGENKGTISNTYKGHVTRILTNQ